PRLERVLRSLLRDDARSPARERPAAQPMEVDPRPQQAPPVREAGLERPPAGVRPPPGGRAGAPDVTSRPDPIDSATDVAAVASTAATRVQGRAHAATRARADARFALAVVLLAAVDWLTVAGCFAAVWEIREKLLRQLFPEL